MVPRFFLFLIIIIQGTHNTKFWNLKEKILVTDCKIGNTMIQMSFISVKMLKSNHLHGLKIKKKKSDFFTLILKSSKARLFGFYQMTEVVCTKINIVYD